jgi:D-3-phosphoglycerate dehydrogenase
MHSDVVIVIPGDDPPQLQGSPHLERLKSHGEVILHADRPSTVEDQVRRAGHAICLVNSRGAVKWPGDLLRRLPRLRMISVCGIGTDAIDLETAKELGIVVCNLPGQTAPIVAEHALGLMLALAKRAWFQTSELKSGRWTSRDNVYLRGKTLGLLGAGSIAAELARLGKAIGMQVLCFPEQTAARCV